MDNPLLRETLSWLDSLPNETLDSAPRQMLRTPVTTKVTQSRFEDNDDCELDENDIPLNLSHFEKSPASSPSRMLFDTGMLGISHNRHGFSMNEGERIKMEFASPDFHAKGNKGSYNNNSMESSYSPYSKHAGYSPTSSFSSKTYSSPRRLEGQSRPPLGLYGDYHGTNQREVWREKIDALGWWIRRWKKFCSKCSQFRAHVMKGEMGHSLTKFVIAMQSFLLWKSRSDILKKKRRLARKLLLNKECISLAFVESFRYWLMLTRERKSLPKRHSKIVKKYKRLRDINIGIRALAYHNHLRCSLQRSHLCAETFASRVLKVRALDHFWRFVHLPLQDKNKAIAWRHHVILTRWKKCATSLSIQCRDIKLACMYFLSKVMWSLKSTLLSQRRAAKRSELYVAVCVHKSRSILRFRARTLATRRQALNDYKSQNHFLFTQFHKFLRLHRRRLRRRRLSALKSQRRSRDMFRQDNHTPKYYHANINHIQDHPQNQLLPQKTIRNLSTLLHTAMMTWRRWSRHMREQSNILTFILNNKGVSRWKKWLNNQMKWKRRERRGDLRCIYTSSVAALRRWRRWVRKRVSLRRIYRVFRQLHRTPKCSHAGRIIQAWKFDFVPRQQRLRKAYRFVLKRHKLIVLMHTFNYLEWRWGQAVAKSFAKRRALHLLQRESHYGLVKWNMFRKEVRKRLLRTKESEALSQCVELQGKRGVTDYRMGNTATIIKSNSPKVITNTTQDVQWKQQYPPDTTSYVSPTSQVQTTTAAIVTSEPTSIDPSVEFDENWTLADLANADDSRFLSSEQPSNNFPLSHPPLPPPPPLPSLPLPLPSLSLDPLSLPTAAATILSATFTSDYNNLDDIKVKFLSPFRSHDDDDLDSEDFSRLQGKKTGVLHVNHMYDTKRDHDQQRGWRDRGRERGRERWYEQRHKLDESNKNSSSVDRIGDTSMLLHDSQTYDDMNENVSFSQQDDDWGIPYVKRLCHPPPTQGPQSMSASSVAFPIFIVHIALRSGSKQRFTRYCINRKTFLHWYTQTVIRKRHLQETRTSATSASAIVGEVKLRCTFNRMKRSLTLWFVLYHKRSEALRKIFLQKCFRKWKYIFRAYLTARMSAGVMSKATTGHNRVGKKMLTFEDNYIPVNETERGGDTSAGVAALFGGNIAMRVQEQLQQRPQIPISFDPTRRIREARGRVLKEHDIRGDEMKSKGKAWGKVVTEDVYSFDATRRTYSSIHHFQSLLNKGNNT